MAHLLFVPHAAPGIRVGVCGVLRVGLEAETKASKKIRKDGESLPPAVYPQEVLLPQNTIRNCRLLDCTEKYYILLRTHCQYISFGVSFILMKKNSFEIPKEVLDVLERLEAAGFEAYAVGGCVRDLFMAKDPKDWDVTTSAKPEEIQTLFPESFYENKFLTVTVQTDSDDPILKEVEVTTFREEGKYSDRRHPDEIRYAETLDEDLARRDFTVNAIALKKDGKTLIDPFDGKADIKEKVIRAVGNPETRFEEDALRMMRAVRLATELDFEIEAKTFAAIKKLSGSLAFIARERIRDELMKIIAARKAREGIELLEETGLLEHIMPELREGIGVTNRPKIFTVWEHNLKSLEYGAKADFSPEVRLIALMHDMGKPRTKGPMKNGEYTYYGHDIVGSRMATEVLTRLHFPSDYIKKAAILIRWHLFKYDPDEGVTDSSVRRLIRNVGAENMSDLVKLRICDRMGMDVPKAVPYRLRHFQFRVEKILREEEAPTPKMLKVNGSEIMEMLGVVPGPKIGQIIEVLMQEVIDNPEKNTVEYLHVRVKELGTMSSEDLKKIASEAEEKTEMVEDERIGKIKAKYWVK